MKPGFFKSATALAVIASLAAPMPGVAQTEGDATFDLSKMSETEIAALVERCREGAEANAEAEGADPIAEFCAQYGEGTYDEALPVELQSGSILSALAPAAEEVSDLEQKLEEAADAEPEPAAAADAGENVQEAPLDEASAAEAEETTAPAETTDSTAETESAEAEQSAEADQAEGAATDADAAVEAEPTTDETAEALAEELVTENADATTTAAEAEAEVAESAPVDNPEVTERNSQEQADALAETQTETTTAAAAGNDAEAEAEVIEETVTEDTARSSAEEFDTKVNETAATEDAAPAAPSAEADKDDGLSKLEKAALLGLGALAVGQLLKSGETVVSNSGDRAVVEQDGQYRVIKNDDALLRQPGSNVKTYQFKDGSTRTVVTREDGIEVETIRAADGRVLRRSKTLTDGRTVVLFDDTQEAEKVVVTELPKASPNRRAFSTDGSISAEDLAAALAAQQPEGIDRRFSLAQVRNIDAVRRLVPEINVDKVTFETGSSVIRPEQAEELTDLGNALRQMVERNPTEVFLIEGHTDAVGAATYNLALSDRRAETVALALTEYFDVPPENMVIQGYGESDLAVPVLDAERANRRVTVRRITPLLASRQ
ncbi:OmpA family protein [Tritonibacter mobilis]|uniref:OmpA family protein n=1 Tax=Tritonibacter mobilis TaxID=379347 RepID=UPI001C09DD21|nr:OmpA family protein [Tritonibacter mobilis]MBU3036140.1 OmpA family protein [Tritonibacter mobilis]